MPDRHSGQLTVYCESWRRAKGRGSVGAGRQVEGQCRVGACKGICEGGGVRYRELSRRFVLGTRYIDILSLSARSVYISLSTTVRNQYLSFYNPSHASHDHRPVSRTRLQLRYLNDPFVCISALCPLNAPLHSELTDSPFLVFPSGGGPFFYFISQLLKT